MNNKKTRIFTIIITIIILITISLITLLHFYNITSKPYAGAYKSTVQNVSVTIPNNGWYFVSERPDKNGKMVLKFVKGRKKPHEISFGVTSTGGGLKNAQQYRMGIEAFLYIPKETYQKQFQNIIDGQYPGGRYEHLDTIFKPFKIENCVLFVGRIYDHDDIRLWLRYIIFRAHSGSGLEIRNLAFDLLLVYFILFYLTIFSLNSGDIHT